MAKITSAEAAKQIGNIFEMVIIASHRARELKRGDQPRVESTNNTCITALKEIELGLYTKRDYYNSINKE
jgi:DNA-directed RNA polymerase omega subunit